MLELLRKLINLEVDAKTYICKRDEKGQCKQSSVLVLLFSNSDLKSDVDGNRISCRYRGDGINHFERARN